MDYTLYQGCCLQKVVDTHLPGYKKILKNSK